MAYTPPKPSLLASPEEPHAFNWPPTDGQLADNFGTLQRENAYDGTGVKTADPSMTPAPASSEPRYAEVDCPPDEGPTQSDSAYPEPCVIEDPPPSSTAVVQVETALDETSAGGWAAEIARLQALIEGLTQKVEWR